MWSTGSPSLMPLVSWARLILLESIETLAMTEVSAAIWGAGLALEPDAPSIGIGSVSKGFAACEA